MHRDHSRPRGFRYDVARIPTTLFHSVQRLCFKDLRLELAKEVLEVLGHLFPELSDIFIGNFRAKHIMGHENHWDFTTLIGIIGIQTMGVAAKIACKNNIAVRVKISVGNVVCILLKNMFNGPKPHLAQLNTVLRLELLVKCNYFRR